jgi:hypothetical protein
MEPLLGHAKNQRPASVVVLIHQDATGKGAHGEHGKGVKHGRTEKGGHHSKHRHLLPQSGNCLNNGSRFSLTGAIFIDYIVSK